MHIHRLCNPAAHLEVSEGTLHVSYFVDPHRLPVLREARHAVRVHALGVLERRLRLLQNTVYALLAAPLLQVAT